MRKSYFFLLFIIYLFSISRINFDLILQGSIVVGFTLGFLNFNYLNWQKLKSEILFIVLMPIIAVLITAPINDLPYTFKSFITITLMFYTIVIAGFGFSRIPINQLYKQAIWAGLMLLILSGASRKLGYGTSASLSIIMATIATLYLGRQLKRPNWWVIICFIAIYPIGQLILTEFPNVLIGVPLEIFIVIISIVTHLIHFSDQKLFYKVIQIGSFVLILVIPIWFIQENYEKYLFSYFENKIPDQKIEYQFITQTGDTLSPSTMAGKKVIYLFWSAYCAKCPAEFPYFSQLAEKLSDSSDIQLIAVFLSYREQDSAYFNETSTQQFHFKWAKALQSEVLMKELLMNGAPHLTIFGDHNEVRYNGLVSNRPWLWVNRPEKYLD